MAFNYSSNLERQLYDNGIDLLGFTFEQAMNIANFISMDYHNRRLRCGFVLRNDCLTRFFRFSAYWYLHKLLELLTQNTPFSIVEENLTFEILYLIENLKWYFEGAWWYQLEAFFLDHEKYNRIFVDHLECIEKLLTERSYDIQTRIKPTVDTLEQQVLAELRETMAQSNCPVDGYEQVLGERLEYLATLKQQLQEELGNTDAELMEVRGKLRDALKARTKLASLEFDISCPSLMREKDTI